MIKKSHSVEELTDPFVHCRTLGHPWDDGPIFEVSFNDGTTAWKQSVVCGSCGTERTQYIDKRTMEVWSRSYYYPDGYQLSVNTDRADIRREYVDRIVRKQK